MKFRKSEHASLIQVILSKQLDAQEFAFTKRKGRLHISKNDREETFSFFRKVSTELVGNQFEETTLFEIKTDQPKGTYSDWNQVLELFDQWLSEG